MEKEKNYFMKYISMIEWMFSLVYMYKAGMMGVMKSPEASTDVLVSLMFGIAALITWAAPSD